MQHISVARVDENLSNKWRFAQDGANVSGFQRIQSCKPSQFALRVREVTDHDLVDVLHLSSQKSAKPLLDHRPLITLQPLPEPREHVQWQGHNQD